MASRMTRRGVMAGALALGAAGRGRAQAAPVIAAAASLQAALPEVAAAFTAETGAPVRLVFGSSGNFSRQIRAGAPFELFLAADESYLEALVTEGLTRDAGAVYAIGRIVLALPEASPLALDGSLSDLAAAVADGRLRRFAIASPEHAPYGMRAEEALRHVGLWEAIAPRLVIGENVSQAAQFAFSGNAEGGIIALSLAMAPAVAERGEHALIPEDYHSPLVQRMALLRGAGPVAAAFHDFMAGEPARAIMRRHGFLLPGETPEPGAG